MAQNDVFTIQWTQTGKTDRIMVESRPTSGSAGRLVQPVRCRGIQHRQLLHALPEGGTER